MMDDLLDSVLRFIESILISIHIPAAIDFALLHLSHFTEVEVPSENICAHKDTSPHKSFLERLMKNLATPYKSFSSSPET